MGAASPTELAAWLARWVASGTGLVGARDGAGARQAQGQAALLACACCWGFSRTQLHGGIEKCQSEMQGSYCAILQGENTQRSLQSQTRRNEKKQQGNENKAKRQQQRGEEFSGGGEEKAAGGCSKAAHVACNHWRSGIHTQHRASIDNATM